MPALSVAIITRNEEANISRTLRSLPQHAEVVVVDCGSTDATVAIAQQHGAKVFEEPWRGFAAQKNFAISLCTGDWVLSLDADEEISHDLLEALISLANEQPRETEPQAYTIARRNLFLGRWMRYGGFYPDAKIRLFVRGAAQFEERPVHEVVRFNGITARLGGDLVHHAYPTLAGYLEHMDRYSSLSAEMVVRSGKDLGSRWWFVNKVLLAPAANFVWNYIFRMGWRDGREGLLLHLYQSVYSSWKYAKAWERVRVRP